nr:MAG TPA: hypothetical protein [Caudoviricetes sp.]
MIKGLEMKIFIIWGILAFLFWALVYGGTRK